MISFPNSISVEEIKRVAAQPEPVLSDLQITQCYHQLSVAFASRMGHVANWCTFATWASKQAGQTIRRQDMKRTLEAIIMQDTGIEAALSLVTALAGQLGVQQSVDELRSSTLATLLATAAGRAADSVSVGNKKVFAEIGHEFSRFMLTCIDDSSYQQVHIEDFCQQLRPGAPPDGQDLLRQAFTCYYNALFEVDAKQKTELSFLANTLIGFHEQTRLQPEIAAAMSASIFDEKHAKAAILDRLLSRISIRSKFILFFKRIAGKTGMLDRAVDSLLSTLQFQLRRALTTHLMTLTIPPDRRLRLGEDLSMSYPGELEQLSNTDLLALIDGIDPTPDSVVGSGTDDWTNLRDRMHFISELFRCCHVSKEMFEPPFSQVQVQSIRQGLVPAGRL